MSVATAVVQTKARPMLSRNLSTAKFRLTEETGSRLFREAVISAISSDCYNDIMTHAEPMTIRSQSVYSYPINIPRSLRFADVRVKRMVGLPENTSATVPFNYDSNVVADFTDNDFIDEYIRPKCYKDFRGRALFGLFDVDFMWGASAEIQHATDVIFACDFVHNWVPASAAIGGFILDTMKTWKPIVQTPSATERKHYKITLGADPEFELFKGTKICNARNHFPYEGKVGTDGAGWQLEVRPEPTTDPCKLVDNIQELIQEANKKGFDISTTGDNQPLGCHIHFGGIDVDPDFLKVLDTYLFEPLKFLNGSARSSYLRPSAYEHKSYGFEYRSLPSGVLAKRTWANVVFTIAKILAENFYNGDGVPAAPTDFDYKMMLGTNYKWWAEMLNKKTRTISYASWRMRRVKIEEKLNGWIKFTGDKFNGATDQQKSKYKILVFGLNKGRGNYVYCSAGINDNTASYLADAFRASGVLRYKNDAPSFMKFEGHEYVTIGISSQTRIDVTTQSIVAKIESALINSNFIMPPVTNPPPVDGITFRRSRTDEEIR